MDPETAVAVLTEAVERRMRLCCLVSVAGGGGRMIPLPTHSAPPSAGPAPRHDGRRAVALRLRWPRYAVRYGQVVDNTRPDCPLTLIEAELRLAKLDAETLRQPPRIGRLLARDAVSLERAIKACRKPAEPRRGWFGRTGR